MQRREAARLDALGQGQGPLLGGQRERYPVRLGDCGDLGDQPPEPILGGIHGAELPDRQPYRSGHAGLGTDEGELGPQHSLDAL
jgi:hypothetical protein